jgi:hypothetical protein
LGSFTTLTFAILHHIYHRTTACINRPHM